MDLNLNQQFEKIIKEQATYQSTNLGCNLLISRMVRQYKNSPTQQQLEKCVEEMRLFFDKYHTIMTSDIEILNNL